MKKPISRTVLPSDSMSIDGGLSVSGMGGYSATLDRSYRQAVPSDYPTATVPRNYHYAPVGGYDDYRGGPPSEAYTSLSRGSHMDERYRYKTLEHGALNDLFVRELFPSNHTVHLLYFMSGHKAYFPVVVVLHQKHG